ncbi:MAG: hypothetical protein IKU38_09855 [Clostridia bacterium]|nr:hypothetical protein [Clostridia bacterium]
MEKKTIDLGAAAQEAGKNAKSFWNKAKSTIINVVDQNSDGSFDMEDVSAIAETIGNAAKHTANSVKASAEERSRELELKQLQPIFVEDLDSADFLISKLIRITEIDKRRAESEVCQGAIGYISIQKDLRIINIFKNSIDEFGLSFYPDTDCELYYVNPSDRDNYIALDDYFSFLKVARINELQKVAQDLGAKHFRVTYKEQKTLFSSNANKAKANMKSIGNHITFESEHDLSSSEVASVEVAAEMHCPGHAPVMPKLHYLQKEPSIQNLIALRMDPTSPIMHQKFTLKLSNSSGIKEKDAMKIDAALKAMKIVGNTTVTNEVRNESRRFFEYEINF